VFETFLVVLRDGILMQSRLRRPLPVSPFLWECPVCRIRPVRRSGTSKTLCPICVPTRGDLRAVETFLFGLSREWLRCQCCQTLWQREGEWAGISRLHLRSLERTAGLLEAYGGVLPETSVGLAESLFEFATNLVLLPLRF
jgi:hypothetical protein